MPLYHPDFLNHQRKAEEFRLMTAWTTGWFKWTKADVKRLFRSEFAKKPMGKKKKGGKGR